MNGEDRLRRRKSLQERLGLKGMACCGSTWGFGPSTISVREDDDEDNEAPQTEQVIDSVPDRTPLGNSSGQNCIGQSPVAPAGMNLAAALAAERHFRAAQDSDVGDALTRLTPNTPVPTPPLATTATAAGTTTAPGTPLRVSLLRLLEESDGVDEKEEKGKVSVCCVCMGRKKGAAFIPCGHTFCRVCSRELWLNRGCCPLCNRSILEILDIY